MSVWEERLSDHQAYRTLAAIRERLAETGDVSDTVSADHLDRIRRVTAQLTRLLEDADPALVTPNLLQIVEATISAVPDLLEEYAEGRETATLERISTHLDDLINDVGWPLVYAGHEPEEMREAAQSYRRSLGQLVRALEREIESARQELPAVSETAASERQAVQEVASGARDEIQAASKSAQRALASVEQRVERQAARLDSVVNDYNSQFLKAQSDIAEKAEASLASEVEKFEAARNQAERAHIEAIGLLQEEGKQGLADIQRLKEDAQKLVNTIGAIGIAGGYGSYADQQRSAANKWGLAAAISLVVLVVIGGFVIVATLGAELDWTQILLRASVSIPAFLFFASRLVSQATTDATSRTLDARSWSLPLSIPT